MILPWRDAEPVEPELFARVRRQAIFDCCKWDPQVEDVATLSPVPLVLRREVWSELTTLAERLTAEALAAEAELVRRPDLHKLLGFPWAVRRALARAARDPAAGTARVLRFDFHHTAEGWRISEVNSDVPGGFNEASGFSRLMAAHVPATEPAGDPAGDLAAAVAAATGPGEAVALVHATAYTDDRQVMVYLSREIAARGRRPLLLGPDHLRWREGRAVIEGGEKGENGETVPLGAIVRFFPAEWLPNLPRACAWRHFFQGARTPVSNPAFALLTQSKRFPLVWDRLATDLPTWRSLLPETVDPRDADWRGSSRWVVKPALGRVGDGIGLTGVTGENEWKAIVKDVRRHPRFWAAQRRFDAVALTGPDGPLYPCIGVYTIGGRAAGAYGRMAGAPLINHLAQDTAVLVETTASRQENAA